MILIHSGGGIIISSGTITDYLIKAVVDIDKIPYGYGYGEMEKGKGNGKRRRESSQASRKIMMKRDFFRFLSLRQLLLHMVSTCCLN